MKTNEIDKLIYLFSKLPGLGPRSSRRIILHLLQDKDVRLNSLIETMSEVSNKIVKCSICGNIDSSEICNICSCDERDNSLIAVVETVVELWAMERSNFNGKYHVLGNSLASVARRNPAELRLDELSNRCRNDRIKEIIIATNANLEGQTTAYFIMESLKDHNIKITRLASGIPMGAELDYLDEGTLSAAFSLRQKLE